METLLQTAARQRGLTMRSLLVEIHASPWGAQLDIPTVGGQILDFAKQCFAE